MSVIKPFPSIIEYPDSDGERMAENPLQFDWIAILKWNAEYYFRNDPNVYVAGDHLIYPVEGNPLIRQAPDMYVAFGPRKSLFRPSYYVWMEEGIFPQVIFEVWSPRNRRTLTGEKLKFYERYGAEEYYILYPEGPAAMDGFLLQEGKFIEVSEMEGFVSPRLGWKFTTLCEEIVIYGPDGRPLRTPDEMLAERDEIAAERDEIATERNLALEKAERLSAKLRELGVDPNSL